jgi:hypothetical protein
MCYLSDCPCCQVPAGDIMRLGESSPDVDTGSLSARRTRQPLKMIHWAPLLCVINRSSTVSHMRYSSQQLLR